MSNDSVARKPRNGMPEHKEAKLSDNLEKRIKAYALAAGAAVAVLAAPRLAEANIVQVGGPGTYSFNEHSAQQTLLLAGLNLRGVGFSGIQRFTSFNGSYSKYHVAKASARLVGGAKFGGTATFSHTAFLAKGSSVRDAFFQNTFRLGTARGRTAGGSVKNAHLTVLLPGDFVTSQGSLRETGYVGLKFAGGSYGWAKVLVHGGGSSKRASVWGTIESVWKNNQVGGAIWAGEKGPTNAAEPGLPVLILFAIGAVALPMWRARRKAAVQGGTEATQA